MQKIFIWLIIFIIIYLFYLFFIILRKEKLKLFKNNSFVRYLVKVYKLNSKKLEMKQMANIVALANAFIIATTFLIIDFVDNFYLKMFLALIILIILQLVIYHIIGKILKRRDKNV